MSETTYNSKYQSGDTFNQHEDPRQVLSPLSETQRSEALEKIERVKEDARRKIGGNDE